MTIRARSVLLLCCLPMLVACYSNLSTVQMTQNSIAAIGGDAKIGKIETVVLKGSGTKTAFGQAQKSGDADPAANLKNLVEVYDYKNGRAAFEYDFELGEFKQHRREVFTKYGPPASARPVGYLMINDRVAAISPYALYGYAAHDSPEIGMRRNFINVMLDIYSSVIEGQVLQDREFNGKMCKFGTAKTKAADPLDIYFDPETELLAGFEITETDTILGETHTVYMFEDFKPVDSVPMPHRVKMSRNGKEIANIQYTSITFGDASALPMLSVPDSAKAEADKAMGGDYVPLELVRIAPGVFQAKGFSHNSLVVEFPRWTVVVEAPQSEIQSKYLNDMIRKEIPRKPIRYVAVTHPHYDHIGGVRGMASMEATILVEKNHQADMKKIFDGRHARPRDQFESRRTSRPPKVVGGMEVYEGKKVISEGGRVLELYAIQTSHVQSIVIAYLPRERVLFESDLYTPGATTATTDSSNLFEAVNKLKLRPDKIVGGHGGIGPFADLAKVARGS